MTSADEPMAADPDLQAGHPDEITDGAPQPDPTVPPVRGQYGPSADQRDS